MKLTQEFKEAFAFQYHFIDCVKLKDEAYKGLITPLQWIEQSYFLTAAPEDMLDYIVLKPIESITNKHAVEVAMLNYDKKDLPKYVQSIKEVGIGIVTSLNNQHRKVVFDKLIEWGYALPFRGVSVENMIEDCILKLKK
jgi:hypothetical protein